MLNHTLSAQREVVQDLKRQLNDLEQYWRSARSRFEDCKQAVVRHQQRSNDLRTGMQTMEDSAEALRDALDKENAEDGRIDALRAALQEAEDEKNLNEGSYQDSETAMSAMMQGLKEIRREMKAKDDSIRALEQTAHVAESERSKVENKRRKILSDKNAAVARIEDDKRAREKVRERLDSAETRVLDYNDKANLISSRVPVDEGETLHSLDQKLERLKRDLERYNHQYVYSFTYCVLLLITGRLGAPRDEIAAEAGRTETAYLQARRQVDDLTILAQVCFTSMTR